MIVCRQLRNMSLIKQNKTGTHAIYTPEDTKNCFIQGLSEMKSEREIEREHHWLIVGGKKGGTIVN